MQTPAHKGNTADFRNLTFAEQAKSINAGIVNLQKAIHYHIQHAPPDKQQEDVNKKCINQVHRLLGRLLTE
jgi:hypothetical protein